MATSIAEIFADFGFEETLYEFYKRAICTTKYKYVIIVPRKCMTEYKCLCKEYEDLAFQKEEVYYMTSKSFVQYKEQMIEDFTAVDNGETFILIIDDIMMHGRGINQVLKNLTKDVPNDVVQRMIEHIYIDIFIESNKKFLIAEEFLPIMEENSNCYYSYNEFKNVLKASDLFLESFYAQLVPNTSFVNAWYYKDGAKGHRMKMVLDEKAKADAYRSDENNFLRAYSIKTKKEQMKYDFHSLIYFEKQEPWMESVAEFCCIRVYYNEKEDNILLVPYVFLKPMTGEQIDNLLKNFQKVLSLPQIWEERTTNDDMYILKYEYLTKLISDCYGAIFMSRYLHDEWNAMNHWDDIFQEDEIVTEFTFGKKNVLSMEDLCNKMKKGSVDMIKEICRNNPADDINVFDEEEDSGLLFKDAVDQENSGKSHEQQEAQVNLSCAQILNTFLKYSNLKDEELASVGEERYFGLSTLRIKNILEERNGLKSEEKSTLYGEMIRCMDIGAASLLIKKLQYKGMLYYGAVLNSGEQAYRELQEKNSVAIHYMALIEQDCHNLCIGNQTEGQIDKFWENVKNDYDIDILSEKFEGISEVRRAIRRRHGSYLEMDIERPAERDEQFDKICRETYKKIKY